MEGEVGLVNAVFSPEVYQRHYKVLRNCFALIVDVTMQKQEGIIGVIPQRAAWTQDSRLALGGLRMSCAAALRFA
ncbi:MAG TPA: hypothetical protein VM537_13540 [Anaerolineae bacterium]|nr:hypothetical protein [Anaerolineae bacterium]